MHVRGEQGASQHDSYRRSDGVDKDNVQFDIAEGTTEDTKKPVLNGASDAARKIADAFAAAYRRNNSGNSSASSAAPVEEAKPAASVITPTSNTAANVGNANGNAATMEAKTMDATSTANPDASDLNASVKTNEGAARGTSSMPTDADSAQVLEDLSMEGADKTRSKGKSKKGKKSGRRELGRDSSVISEDEAQALNAAIAANQATAQTASSAAPRSNQPQPQSQGQQQGQQQQQQPQIVQPIQNTTIIQQQPAQEKSDYDKIKDYFKEVAYKANRGASKKNKKVFASYAKWRNEGKDASGFDLDRKLNQEGFPYSLGSIAATRGMDLDEYEKRVAAGEDVSPEREEEARKPTEKQDRLIDRFMKMFQIGFIPIESQHIVENKDGSIKKIRWSKQVNQAIADMERRFGWTGISGQRNVFRLVMLYANMSVDRNGKMFGQDGEWYLKEHEFLDICELIQRSIVMYGHPFMTPNRLSNSDFTLRGTRVYPSGVMPRVLAEAMCGEKSSLCYPDGKGGSTNIKIDADSLIEMCRQNWNQVTYPDIKHNLRNSNVHLSKRKKQKLEEEGRNPNGPNLEAQKVVIEDVQQAVARLDGMTPEEFSDKYSVDTEQHYTLGEYADVNAKYALALNNLYDAQAVNERVQKNVEFYKEEARRQHSAKIGTPAACLNIISSGIKVNALWWNVPIMVSAIGEKAVGNVVTASSIFAIRNSFFDSTDLKSFDVSDEVRQVFGTDESIEAVDSALLLLDIGGPGALQLFVRSKQTLGHDEVMKFLSEEYLPQAKSDGAANIVEMNEKLNKFSQKILAGDRAFRKMDMQLFIESFIASNQALADVQKKMKMRTGEVDAYGGQVFTGEMIDDAWLASNKDPYRFITDIVGTPAGRNALIMHRENNITKFNIVGYRVSSFLRRHGVTNALVIAFFDKFPVYGINFVRSMIPFSRTFQYLHIKAKEYHGDDPAIADYVLGGFLGQVNGDSRFGTVAEGKAIFNQFFNKEANAENAGFIKGLTMNIWFDCMTFGRWCLTGAFLGAVFSLLKFEWPDDPEDNKNSSKFKIAGQEIQFAYWLNDIAQWSLPIAYASAALWSGMGKETAMDLFFDSLYDQFDGNIVLDCIDGIKGFGEDVIELNQQADDPNYKPVDFNLPTAVTAFALSNIGSLASKVTPGSPLYHAISQSSFLRGEDARQINTNYVYGTEEWEKEVGKLNYIEDPVERMLRKYAARDLLTAGIATLMAETRNEEYTPYWWWAMPPKTRADQRGMVLAEKLNIQQEEGESEGEYQQRCADFLKEITDQYGSPEEAMQNGDLMFIPHDLRYAACDYYYAEINAIKNEWHQRELNQDFDTYDDWFEQKQERDAYIDSLYDYIDTWLKNDDIPEWYDSYEVLLSDYDVTYLHDDGSPALPWEQYILGNNVTAEWKLKGNHPNTLAPFTLVDFSSNEDVERAWSGETRPYWANENTDLEAIKNLTDENGNPAVIPYGVDAGKPLNDVLFGKEYTFPVINNMPLFREASATTDANGMATQMLHGDDVTVGHRAWVPRESKLSSDIKNLGTDTTSGSVYGDMGKASDDDSSGSSDTTPWKSWGDTKPWKSSGSGKSFYPSKSYGHGTSSYGNYSPKIYSNPRSINADKAASMYTKTPNDARTDYLRPSFATKGSREAYRRQDF